MKRSSLRLRARALLVVVALAAAISPASVSAAPPCSCPIQDAYKVAGSWGVTHGTTTDQGGAAYELWYPTQLGAGGYTHPVITWGNGTNGVPQNYEEILSQFASWGFVVIASVSGQTGLGNEILAGANWMVTLNGTSSSIFYQKLDTAKIGAAGHSQGAGGAVNATIMSSGLIKSTMPFNLPDPRWWTTPLPDWSQISNPIHFFTGSTDKLSTATWQTNFYNQVPGAAAKASLKSAGHNVIQNANNGYFGYATAWFRYTLAGDTVARGAFVGNPPEINANASFLNQAQKNLP